MSEHIVHKPLDSCLAWHVGRVNIIPGKGGTWVVKEACPVCHGTNEGKLIGVCRTTAEAVALIERWEAKKAREDL